ncbi:hypothetical protein [Thalassolituus oleivorans]|uniref:hypothetical protein n=1 Tax=Thalassolituus oleivorans TaxID=187493 RepID=UPI0023F1E93F|nr:hypothetical protein [Thalassolituus oleivorans]
MPIHRTSAITQHTKRLDDAIESIKKVLNRPPTEDIYKEFAHDKEEFKRDFRSINPDELDHAISEATSALKLLAKLKKNDPATRLHRD